MRYLVTWEFAAENVDKLIAKEIKYQEMIVKNPEKYPKNVIPVHIIDSETAVTVLDVDDPEQIQNKLIYMMPEGRATIVPIFESANFIKLMMQTKK